MQSPNHPRTRKKKKREGIFPCKWCLSFESHLTIYLGKKKTIHPTKLSQFLVFFFRNKIIFYVMTCIYTMYGDRVDDGLICCFKFLIIQNMFATYLYIVKNRLNSCHML
jgi:hypothetical protein